MAVKGTNNSAPDNILVSSNESTTSSDPGSIYPLNDFILGLRESTLDTPIFADTGDDCANIPSIVSLYALFSALNALSILHPPGPLYEVALILSISNIGLSVEYSSSICESNILFIRAFCLIENF